jgi:hypothetical protein
VTANRSTIVGSFVGTSVCCHRSRTGGVVLSDLERLTNELIDAGVDGVDEFGRFVNDTTYFEPSRFDAAVAAPVLLRMLPELSDPRLVSTVGRHLQARSVRRIDGAFEVVLDAYRRWATSPGEVGWVLGDTLARLSDKTRARLCNAPSGERARSSSSRTSGPRPTERAPELERLDVEPAETPATRGSGSSTSGGDGNRTHGLFDATEAL